MNKKCRGRHKLEQQPGKRYKPEDAITTGDRLLMLMLQDPSVKYMESWDVQVNARHA